MRMRYSREDLRSDVFGGITAGVVGLPLALALGEGSGLGAIAGMPSAGVTVLTGANIRAGAKTRVSGILCAAILLAVVLGVGPFLEVIPHAALAAILMRISWDIIDWRFLTRMRQIEREHLVVMAVTLGLTVFVDLLTAVAVGLVVAGMIGARRFERLQLDKVVSVPLLDQTFLYADVDLFDLDDDVDMFAARTGLVGLKAGEPATTLQSLNVLRHIPADHIVDDLDSAREVAKRLLNASEATE